MALIDNYLKKKDLGTPNQSGSLLIDRYVKPKTQVTSTEPVKQPISLLDRVKSVSKAGAQFVARTGVETVNLLSSTFDFAADFLGGQVKKIAEKPTKALGPLGAGIDLGLKVTKKEENPEAGKKRAERWQSFYDSTAGSATEKVKTFTQELRNAKFIKPSDEWTKSSTKEKFTTKLPETILNIGPGIVSSLGLYAINPVVGFAASAGSTADELKTVAKENGVSNERAELLGLGTGLLVGWLDKIVPDEVFSPAQKKAFIGGFAKRVLKTGLKETVTEVAQEDIQLLAESTVREDITKNEVVVRNLMSGLGGLLGGVGAQTSVSFIQGIKNGDIAGGDEVDVKNMQSGESVTSPNAPERPIAPVGDTDTTEEVAQPSINKAEGVVSPKQEEKEKPVEISEIRKQRIQEVTKKIEKNVTDIKTVKSSLKRINIELGNAVTEAEGRAEVAKIKREGLNTENIAKLKTIYANTKAFQEGDIETIRASKHGDLVNTVIENMQEVNPTMTEEEAFNAAVNLPTKAQESARTPQIRELEKKQKNLSDFMELLKKRQDELNIEEDNELSKEWTQAMAMQEKLVKLVQVPSSQLPVGEGKQKVSRLQARLKGALEKTSQEDIDKLGLATYRQATNDEQMEKVREYAKNNTEEAIKAANGEIDPPEGMLQNSLWIALTEMGAFDTDLATKLATLRSTRAGQEIQILKMIQPDNPVIMMQEIVQSRIEAYEKKTGNKVTERVKKEAKSITEKAKPTTKEQWNSFIESIRC